MRSKQAVLITLVLAMLMSVFVPPSHANVNVSFEGFYSNLSPHGTWMVSAEFGRVWQPRVYRPDWNPYYDGHWEYADVGWTWVSDYSWGAIPYHYGTWTLDPVLGWVWVPGYTWAPAWVVFRTGPGYIGWAPVAPSFAIGVTFGSYTTVTAPYLFVSTQHFAAPRIRTYAVQPVEAQQLVRVTRPVQNLVLQNGIVVNRGPDVRTVEAATRRKIQVSPVESVPRVAPFHNVNRSQLAIPPEQSRQAVRAAEPMRTSQVAPARPGSSVEQKQGPKVKSPKDKKAKKPKGDHGKPDKERRTS
jgi:hypothetical protein